MKQEKVNQLDRITHHQIDYTLQAVACELHDQGYTDLEIRKYFQSKYSEILTFLTSLDEINQK